MKKVILILSLISGFFIYPEVTFAKNEAKTESVMVDLSPNQPVHKLFPLTILSVDGETVINRNEFIMLAPGEHTLKFSAKVDFSYFTGNEKILRTQVNRRKYGDTLVLNVEANNKYQLAFDARPHKVDDWKPILLNVTKINTK